MMETPRERDNESIAQRIQRMLNDRNWFGADLERESGVHRNTIGRILRGVTQTPDDGTVDMLAKAFGVSPAYLRYGKEDAPAPTAPDIVRTIEALIQISPAEAELVRLFRSASPALQESFLKTARLTLKQGK